MGDLKNSINDKLDNVFSPKGKKIFLILIVLAIVAAVVFAMPYINGNKNQADEDMAYLPSIDEVQKTEDETAKEEKKQEIDVLEQDVDKMVSVTLDDVGRANPFLPASESISKLSYNSNLMAPPEYLAIGSEASKVMTTKISGILYDPKNPSAILNIEGSDYLVRSGDYINSYKVLSITNNMVTVQLGPNIYKAKVGEVISGPSLNYNTVYNLQNKFGGAKK